jgi:hypothetical protein
MNEALSKTLKVLLALAVQAHVAHWAAKSGYQHTVLGELYVFAHAAADRLAEPAIAVLGLPAIPVGDIDVKVQSTGGVDLGAAIGAVVALSEEAELVSPWLSNMAQEIEGKLYEFKYKFDRLS